MDTAFIIMQIGNPELDRVYEEAIKPAFDGTGLAPKRIDTHTRGGLLRSEIDGLIRKSVIIVADLTNERPNCYLEIGYAFGLGKETNVILTVKEDHGPDSPNRVPGGHKVHFDLAGHAIFYWEPTSLAVFRDSLGGEIQRRMRLVSQKPGATGNCDGLWFRDRRQRAWEVVKAPWGTPYFELALAVEGCTVEYTLKDLKRAVGEAVDLSGAWPLAVVVPECDIMPKPHSGGIGLEWLEWLFQYWFLDRAGRMYCLERLSDDRARCLQPGGPVSEAPELITAEGRIHRVTSAFLYASRLYASLGVPGHCRVSMSLTHGGLRNMKLESLRPGLAPLSTDEFGVTSQLELGLAEIPAQLAESVGKVVERLLEVFEFSELSRTRRDELVKHFEALERVGR